MDIDVDSISKRGGFGNERYERRDFQLKVWEAYQVCVNDFASLVFWLNALHYLPKDK